ncbi:MAG TPA: hypothetical protein DCQ30_15290 [Acidimicrobiaceae bacterium]|nr:hypothetical protein [Acidimicrobiaceae bacterium]
MSKPKAVIVGSGASGGMVARLLARADWDVVILEKGNSYITFPGASQGQVRNPGITPDKVSNLWANDEVGYEARPKAMGQDPLLEPRSFRVSTSAGKREFVGDVNTLPTTVGGGTAHYDAKFRRLREIDFVTNSAFAKYAGTPAGQSAIPNANYADWPMQYKHLEAFYAIAEEVVGVQGPAHRDSSGRIVNPNPHESWRSTPFAMPPGPGQLNSLLPYYAANVLGYGAAPVPTSIISRPYRGRSACVNCSFCLDYGCPVNAKGGGVWQVVDALAAGAQLIWNANVVNFEFGPSSGGRQAVSAVNYLDLEPTRSTYGTIQTITLSPGDVFVLGNTPIEATRLSLLSGIGGATHAYDPSHQLGANLMFHLQTNALAVMNEEIHSFRGRTSTHTMDAFAGAGPTVEAFDPAIPRGGIMEMGGNLNPIQAGSEVAAFLYGEPLKTYMSLAPFTQRLVAFTLQGEDMPQLSNLVDLDPDIVDVYGVPVPRVTYQSHPYELAASAYYAPKMLEILEAIGGPGTPYPTIHALFAASINTTLPPALPGTVDAALLPVTSQTPFNNIPASRHILGTHRMALTPDGGPCDPFGRYWNFDNLYHAGGGLWVTAAGFNVTLTMSALSYWAAAALVAGIGAGNASAKAADMDGTAATLRNVIAAYDQDTMIGQVIKGGYTPQ